jgi:hypothetical protein
VAQYLQINRQTNTLTRPADRTLTAAEEAADSTISGPDQVDMSAQGKAQPGGRSSAHGRW